MSRAVISLSRKDSQQALLSIGGLTYDDYYQNMLAFAGGDVSQVDEYLAGWRQIVFGSTVAQAQLNLQQGGLQPQELPQQTLQSYQQQPQQYQDQQPYAQSPYGAPQYQQQAPPAPPRTAGGPPPGMQVRLCPNHGQPARWVAPGVSKATNKPYSGFFSCAVSERGDYSCKIPR